MNYYVFINYRNKMNSITAEIINLTIFILVFLVLYFNLIDNNLYLKNFLIVLVIDTSV